MNRKQLFDDAVEVLVGNDMGEWTRPTSVGLYPHQWLWDSFFIGIGLRHIDIRRAQAEVRSPFRAQWANGMVPHIIFSDSKGYHAGPELWRCQLSPDAPDAIETTGITQPPVAAEAVIRIGEMLPKDERLEWYAEMYPKVLLWHQWFYRERNPRGDGLVRLLHPWESGMDNSPTMMSVMQEHALSLRVRLMKGLRLEMLAERRRKDTAAVPAEERISTLDLHGVYDLILSLRRLRYDGARAIARHKFQVIDVTVNAILMRANEHLDAMAQNLGETLPPDIRHAMKVAPASMETLWDEEAQQYYSRNALTRKPIPVAGIGTFMPLYGQHLPRERRLALLRHLHDPLSFGATYPVPSTPLNSPWFQPQRYWQGPTWVNMNWMIADGLERNQEVVEAESLRARTLEMVAKSGIHEYYSPLDATKAGAATFSWTAALVIDLLKRRRLESQDSAGQDDADKVVALVDGK
jgi:hypothetical protein